jgi:succinyl-CoA synthetase beta subunit
MTQLYSTLAKVYHEMYQHIFDYDKEFQEINSLIKTMCRTIPKYHC